MGAPRRKPARESQGKPAPFTPRGSGGLAGFSNSSQFGKPPSNAQCVAGIPERDLIERVCEVGPHVEAGAEPVAYMSRHRSPCL